MKEQGKPYGKLEIKLGNLSFSGEGDQDWLAGQLQKVIGSAASLSKAIPGAAQTDAGSDLGAECVNNKSLATYLKEKNAEKNQNMRFLATANWLRLRDNKRLLTSSAVSKTLSDNHQSRLGNPADCLNQNVRKGYCEKKSDGFFITPEGLAVLN